MYRDRPVRLFGDPSQLYLIKCDDKVQKSRGHLTKSKSSTSTACPGSVRHPFLTALPRGGHVPLYHRTTPFLPSPYYHTISISRNTRTARRCRHKSHKHAEMQRKLLGVRQEGRARHHPQFIGRQYPGQQQRQHP